MAILLYAPPNIAIQPLCRVFEHSGLAQEVVHKEESFLAAARALQHAVVVVISTTCIEDVLDIYEKWKLLGRTSAFIVLSSRQSGYERVRALQAGITSYHIAPFSYTQLVTDIAQHEYLRDRDVSMIEAHGIAIDIISRTATFEGIFLKLTKKQFDLLTMLARNPGHVFTRVQIWEALWNDGEYPLANTVDVHVNRLRRVLPKGAGVLIETIYGFGYRLKPR